MGALANNISLLFLVNVPASIYSDFTPLLIILLKFATSSASGVTDCYKSSEKKYLSRVYSVSANFFCECQTTCLSRVITKKKYKEGSLMPEVFKIFNPFMFKSMPTDPIYLPDGNVMIEAIVDMIIFGLLL